MCPTYEPLCLFSWPYQAHPNSSHAPYQAHNGHSTYFTLKKIEHDPNGTFINPQWREAKNKGKGVIGQKSGIYGAPFEGI
jgi:hypothetical protein